MVTQPRRYPLTLPPDAACVTPIWNDWALRQRQVRAFPGDRGDADAGFGLVLPLHTHIIAARKKYTNRLTRFVLRLDSRFLAQAS